MILVFAGAGASAAIDPKKYPTTEGFYSMLPSSIKDDHLFVVVREFLEASNTKPIDIEHVLYALEEIRNHLLKTHDTSRIVGWMTLNAAFERLDKNFATAHLHKSSPVLISHCSNLIESIREFLYALYGASPEEKELKQWRALLKNLQVIDPHVEIFTTNYDMVLEYAIDVDYLNINDGKDSDGQHTQLNMRLWDNPGIPLVEGLGRLTKLHGSVDWQRHIGSSNSIFISPIFTGDLQKQVALYPGGTKKEPEEWPFVKFYKHFESSAEQAERFVFVGFSFRDEYINNILQENAIEAKKYIITKGSPYTLPDFIESDITRYNDNGFTMDSIKDCLIHLS